MLATHEPERESDGALHRGMSETGLAAVSPISQVHQHRVDTARIERAARELLEAIGEDIDRDGLKDTPARYARWWKEFIEHTPGNMGTAFEQVSSGQIVIVSGMRVWSLCEHHLLPFWCDVTIAYRPNAKVLGLSKFARIAHHFAHRLQVQERLAEQIAAQVCAMTGSEDVAVHVQGEHLCMTMRGVQTPARMSTIVKRGQFEKGTDLDVFLRLAGV